MYRSNLATAETFEPVTEWIVENRHTGKRAFVVANSYERAAFVGLQRFKLHSIDDINVEPHEAITAR